MSSKHSIIPYQYLKPYFLLWFTKRLIYLNIVKLARDKTGVIAHNAGITNTNISRILTFSKFASLHLEFSSSLHKKCPCSELFWSAFSRIQIEYGEIRSISPHSV